MHTLTISIQGAANDSTSVELPDDQALPIYVKLKEVVGAQWELPGACGAWKPGSRPRFLPQSRPAHGHSVGTAV